MPSNAKAAPAARRAPRPSLLAGLPLEPAFRVGFFLVPEFAMMSFAAAIEPLRAANRLAGATLFQWTLHSRDGAPVRASNGIDVAVQGSLKGVPALDLLLVCAGTPDAGRGDKALCAWLQAVARSGAAVGGVSLGAFALAHAGLLDGRRCALHWESLGAFGEAFPRIRTTTDIFVVDGPRFTCSGGTAALDMMLHLIAGRHGRALANDVSEQFIHPRIRDTHDKQRMAVQSRLGIANRTLIAAVGMMEAAVEEPRDVRDIARALGVSPRQLERLFARYLKASPSRFYLDLRLERARTLLGQTTRPILEVAIACGFASASHFSRCYRSVYGRKPSEERAPPAPEPRRRPAVGASRAAGRPL